MRANWRSIYGFPYENRGSDIISTKQEALQEAMEHLKEEYGVAIENVLVGEKLFVAWNIDELHPADAQYWHEFKLTDGTSIFQPLQSFAEKLNKIMTDEINMKLKSETIKPTNYSWGFLVVILRKEDGSSMFCVDYRTLNKRMKADIFRYQKLKKSRTD